MFLTASAAIALLGSTAAVTPVSDIAEPNPKKMSQSEIRAFNATVAANHPYYIRCKRTVATGSLTARLYSCRTNEQWARAEDLGNQEARDIMEEMQSKSWNTSG